MPKETVWSEARRKIHSPSSAHNLRLCGASSGSLVSVFVSVFVLSSGVLVTTELSPSSEFLDT